MSAQWVCYLCGSDDRELRPYGKGGQPICFDCMMGDESREEEAKRQFAAQLDAAGPVAVLGDGESGPRPLAEVLDDRRRS